METKGEGDLFDRQADKLQRVVDDVSEQECERDHGYCRRTSMLFGLSLRVLILPIQVAVVVHVEGVRLRRSFGNAVRGTERL